MIISFVIPVYNTSQYIQRCVESITSQLEGQENLCEIVIVNDGSTDNSQTIINNLIEQYPSIVSCFEQENKGPGASRNKGLLLSKGKYILFIDSDDYIYPNSLASLIELAKASNADVIDFGVYEKNTQNQLNTYKNHYQEPIQTISGSALLLKHNISGGAWGYLLARTFLLEKNLRMPENIYLEDDFFLAKTILFASDVQIIDTFVYVYDRREESITTSQNKTFKNKKNNDSIILLEEFIKMKSSYILSDDQVKALDRKIKLFAQDIVINLIRLRIDKELIYRTLDKLKDLHLYPLLVTDRSLKYYLFKFVTYRPSFVWIVSQSDLVRKYLSRI